MPQRVGVNPIGPQVLQHFPDDTFAGGYVSG
jgi:hypothetical protein